MSSTPVTPDPTPVTVAIQQPDHAVKIQFAPGNVENSQASSRLRCSDRRWRGTSLPLAVRQPSAVKPTTT